MPLTQYTQGITSEDRTRLTGTGMDWSEKTRQGSFMQEDSRLLFSHSLFEGVTVERIEDAIHRDAEIKAHYGRAFRELNKEFPEDTEGGYAIRVQKGATVELPIQACLHLKSEGFKQKIHNLIIVEEGAHACLINGCASSNAAREGFHLGISEFFVKKGGYLNFTMVHSWREDVSVKPLSIALIDEDAQFISNYICLHPVKEIAMYPMAVLQGDNARASFNSLIVSHPRSLQDIGSKVILKGRNTSAEIIARSVSLGGKVINRGHLKAENAPVKAHLECRGLLVSEKGVIHAIPELETGFRDVDMSHEAAIGRISNEEIEYLCARGFTADEAQSVIIRGFMDVEILSLPDALKQEIQHLQDQMLEGMF